MVIMFEVYSVFFLFLVFVPFEIAFSAELISTYSKVARWGSNNTKLENQARSNGDTFWKPRISSKTNEPVEQPVYYYSMKSSPSKIDLENIDSVPAKGEVEERFNPRPYFDFVFQDSPHKLNPQSKPNKPSDNNSPAIVYSSPDGLPLSKPSVDLYSSPFSSYNPPVNGNKPQPQPPSASKPSPSVKKPPTDSYSSPFSSYNPPNEGVQDAKPPKAVAAKKPLPYKVPDEQISKPIPDESHKSKYNQYLPPNLEYDEKPPSNSFNLYDSPNPNHNDSKPTQMDKPQPTTNTFKQPEKKPPPVPSYGFPDFQLSYPTLHKDKPFAPSAKPSKPHLTDYSEDDAYPDTMLGYESPMVQTPMPAVQQQPKGKPQSMSMAEDDLSPPPKDMSFGKFPQYVDHDPYDHDFYNFHHDHNVYHEVHTTAPTTTSTAAPRAGHYSYYFLGRKLWYIPLYFSVYFIVYVTVLILKSIARHKIQFSHYFDKGRSARKLDVDVLNQTVITAIEESKNKYM